MDREEYNQELEIEQELDKELEEQDTRKENSFFEEYDSITEEERRSRQEHFEREFERQQSVENQKEITTFQIFKQLPPPIIVLSFVFGAIDGFFSKQSTGADLNQIVTDSAFDVEVANSVGEISILGSFVSLIAIILLSFLIVTTTLLTYRKLKYGKEMRLEDFKILLKESEGFGLGLFIKYSLLQGFLVGVLYLIPLGILGFGIFSSINTGINWLWICLGIVLFVIPIIWSTRLLSMFISIYEKERTPAFGEILSESREMWKGHIGNYLFTAIALSAGLGMISGIVSGIFLFVGSDAVYSAIERGLQGIVSLFISVFAGLYIYRNLIIKGSRFKKD